MKTIAYTKRCMLLLFLLCIVHSLSSQEKTDASTVELSDSINQSAQEGVKKSLFEEDTDSVSLPVETRACVNSFMNQTVRSVVSVAGCSELTVQYVTVATGGYLSLSAPDDVTINGTFDVVPGAALDVGVASAPAPSIFNYLYDASGNRIARQYGSVVSAIADGRSDEGNEVSESAKVTESVPAYLVVEQSHVK